MTAVSDVFRLVALIASLCRARRAAAQPHLFPHPPDSGAIDDLSKPDGGNVLTATAKGLIGTPAVNNKTGASLFQYATFQCGKDPTLGAADLEADRALLQGFGMLGCGTDFPLYEVYAGALFSQYYGALSDGRYKTHVIKMASMSGREAFEAIKRIDFYSFQWKRDRKRHRANGDETHRDRAPYADQWQFGVLAEELRSVLPEVVFESSVDRGDDKALYVNLPAMLYKTMHATQHMAHEMEAHDSRADDAQAAISEIRQELAELTRDVREMKALVSAAVADRYEQREGRAGGGQGDVGPPLVDALQDLIPRMGRDD